MVEKENLNGCNIRQDICFVKKEHGTTMKIHTYSWWPCYLVRGLGVEGPEYQKQACLLCVFMDTYMGVGTEVQIFLPNVRATRKHP